MGRWRNVGLFVKSVLARLLFRGNYKLDSERGMCNGNFRIVTLVN